MSSKHTSLKRLGILTGEWDVEAFVDGKSMGKDRSVFASMENGAFMVQHVRTISTKDVPAEWIEHLPTPIVTIIGLDDTSEEFTQLYTDARGVSRVYKMSLEGGVWKLWREAPGFNQRFEGKFSKNGRKIIGFWEVSEDGKQWKKDFDLTYTRVG